MIKIYWLLFIVGCLGWWFNLYHIFSRFSSESTNDLILQVVGIFAAPIGAILGWIQ